MNNPDFIQKLSFKFGKDNIYAFGVALVFTVLIIFISIFILYNSYNSYALDLGLFTQTLKYTLQGDILYTTIDQGCYLADHFSPILFLLVPIYWLFPYAQTLLVVQAVSLGFAAFLAYKLARDIGFSHRIGIIVELLFCINPLLWGLILFDFHTESLAVLFLMLMFVGMVNKKKAVFYAGFILALMTKEVIVIVLAIFGFTRFIITYIKEKRVDKQSLIIFIVSLMVYGIAILVASLVTDNDSAKMLDYFSSRYAYINEPFWGMVTGAINKFFSADSLVMFTAYLLPFALLSLFSLSWAIPGIFILLANILSTYSGQNDYFYQYASPALPFLYIAFLFTLYRVMNNPKITAFWKNISPRVPFYFFSFILAVSLVIVFSPASRIKKMELPNEYIDATNEVISMIPDGATVTAPNDIFAHICNRTEVYMPHLYDELYEGVVWGYPERYTEYVVIDWVDFNSYYPKGRWTRLVSKTIYDEYESIILIGKVELFRLKE